MEIRLLGYQGAMSRMHELQARAEELNPRPKPAAPNAAPATEFDKLLGPIGKGSLNSDVKPFDPLGQGVKINGKESPNQLLPMIRQAAANAGLDPHLLDALVSTESGYDPLARSGAGAMGLTQLMPGTAKSLGVENPFDPWQSLTGGANYLSQMIKKYNGDIRLALAAYNAGPGAVEKYGGLPPYKETQNYVDRVLSRYEAKRIG